MASGQPRVTARNDQVPDKDVSDAAAPLDVQTPAGKLETQHEQLSSVADVATTSNFISDTDLDETTVSLDITGN